MVDLATREGAEQFFAWRLERAREFFHASGYLPPTAVLFGTASAGDLRLPEGAPIGIIEVTPHDLGDDASKDSFVGNVEALVHATRAIAVCVLFEAWILTARDAAEVERVRAEGSSIASHPNRREGIHASIEHIRMPTISRVAFIARDAAGRPTLGPFEPHRNDRGEAEAEGEANREGRFANLLHRERFA